MDAVHRYEGYVAQALGDGIFALCWRAALPMKIIPSGHCMPPCACKRRCGAMPIRSREQGIRHCLMRVGVNTGEVVVRSIRKEDLHTDYVPVGHSTNLAARMEQLAAPGSILVTAHTHKLTDGLF